MDIGQATTFLTIRLMIIDRVRLGNALLALSTVFIFAYLMNYVWESFHAVFLYQDHDFKAEKYVLMLNYVAAMDGLLIVGMYVFVAILWKEALWLKEMNIKQTSTTVALGLLIAALIEHRKVVVLKTWAYLPAMPTIFGIGISPLLQLSASGLLSIWLARRVWFSREKDDFRRNT
ncbi:MAG: hypothetical protein M0Z67_02850 [Nitrospiraceae bacterium]|nr:hypothetical protein [Nitrospiraceae bacterium]